MGSQRNRLLPTLLGTVAVAAIAGGTIGGTGLYSTLTENVNRTQEIKAGTVILSVGGGDGSLNDSVSGIMPGGTISSNAMEVKNGGSLQFGKVDASVKATGELLDDPAPFAVYTVVDDNGVPRSVTGRGGSPASMTLKSCTAVWNGDLCTGLERVEFGPARPLSVTRFNLLGAEGLMPGDSIYLKTFYTLPASAGQEYYGTGATVDYKMTAHQRDAETVSGSRGY